MDQPSIPQGGFQKEAFGNLFQVEDSSFWFVNRSRLIIWLLKKYFPDMETYIEIGCGTGYVLNGVSKAFPKCHICGSELFEEGLEFAKHRVPEAELLQLDAEKLDTGRKYNAFGAYDVLEHIRNDEKVMRNLHESLQCERGTAGGVITVPQHMFMWSSEDDAACHVRRYSQKELRSKLESAGFKVLKMTGFVSLLFPFMYLSRKKKKNTTPSQNKELQLPRWLNSIFSLVMGLELGLIKIGIRFPFGGSIVAVVAA